MKLIEVVGYLGEAEYTPELQIPFPNNPTLQQWYKKLPQCNVEDVEKLINMWNLIHTKL
ncbi:hypothetical protein U5N28_17515 [Lysinibacillus telephonicus]|uniref:hypothetical protein n=1 Tax=Lysinibacillus telephonicus TaxID=1714840 RepID=UPI00163B5343|nr:hypothetical protein [Lysinibacillus telephonicus]